MADTMSEREFGRRIRETHGAPRDLRAAEVAKLIRKRLKTEFPGTKFSVRTSTFAGGAAVDVRYTDGPSLRYVEAVVGDFTGARFDGMIDLGWTVDHWLLPDGAAVVAVDSGSEGSRGVHPALATIKPHDDAELVSFGNLYTSVNRTLSVGFLEKLAARIAADAGAEPPRIVEGYGGGGTVADEDRNRSPIGNAGPVDFYWHWTDVLFRASRRLAEGDLDNDFVEVTY
jgi:hypothetical protein